jgi:hypothetical protein
MSQLHRRRNATGKIQVGVALLGSYLPLELFRRSRALFEGIKRRNRGRGTYCVSAHVGGTTVQAA